MDERCRLERRRRQAGVQVGGWVGGRGAQTLGRDHAGSTRALAHRVWVSHLAAPAQLDPCQRPDLKKRVTTFP